MKSAHQIILASALLICGAAAGSAQEGADQKWTSLFDGKSLIGWHIRGGQASYHVDPEANAIVGVTKIGTPNTFLCSDKVYGDFILEYEFHVDPKMNSGVQIRSNPREEDGVVWGYQIEIDPSDRAWTAGIYEESGRGWLNPLKDNLAAQKAFKQNAWNHVRIEAIGDSLKTFLNGVPAADLKDGRTAAGFIGLQVHNTESEAPLLVKWRNLRIQDLGVPANAPELPAPGSRKLGYDAWTQGDGGCLKWVWDSGSEVLATAPKTGGIESKENFNDFRMHLEFNLPILKDVEWGADGNSGVYIQGRYEVQIINSYMKEATDQHCAAIYKVSPPSKNVALPPGEWQEFEIIFRAPRWNESGVKTENAYATVYWNGELVQDNVEIPGKTGSGRPEGVEAGPIVLQDHGSAVQFRAMKITPLELPTADTSIGAALKAAPRR